MKNDSTSFFENNHFANSYVYDISISHVPAYFGLHWHHYIEIVLAQDDGIIYEVNGETFPLNPGDLLFIPLPGPSLQSHGRSGQFHLPWQKLHAPPDNPGQAPALPDADVRPDPGRFV